MASDAIYQGQVDSGIAVVKATVFTNPGTDPLRSAASSSINDALSAINGISFSLLFFSLSTLFFLTQKFRSQPQYWPPTSVFGTQYRCAIHHYTYRNYGGTLGLAYVGVACTTSFNSGVTTDFGLSANQLTMTVAHVPLLFVLFDIGSS